MRNVRRILGVLALALTAAAPAAAQDKAAEVLAAAREAIGGGKLASLKALRVEGSTARNMGERRMTSEIEILVEVPDKYIRIEDMTAPIARTITNGFSGDKAIRPAGAAMSPGGGMMIVMGGPGGAPPAPKMTPEQEAELNTMLLRTQRTEISRLMLGWTAMTHPSLQATYTYAGEAESPDGKAHVIDVKAGEFEAKLFIDQATNLPLMLTYTGPEPRTMTMRGPGGPGGGPATTFSAGAPPPAAGAGAHGGAQAPTPVDAMRMEPPKMVDYQLYFSDWRESDGIKFPHMLQRATGGNTVEEWEIAKATVNPKIDPKKFQ